MSLGIRSDVVDLFPGSVSMDQSFESPILDLRGANGFSIELSWENGFDPVGTISISVSNSGDVWVPVWSIGVASDSGSEGRDYLACNFSFAKVNFEYTSGADAVMTGSATIKRY